MTTQTAEIIEHYVCQWCNQPYEIHGGEEWEDCPNCMQRNQRKPFHRR